MQLTDTFLNGYTFAFCEKRGFTKGQGWRWMKWPAPPAATR